MKTDAMAELVSELRKFAKDRDWEQFHSPKNLAAALSVETAEVLEHFQWITEAQSLELPPDKRKQVELELADVLLYLLRLSDRLGVDLLDAARRKIKINGKKYPVAQARGTHKKYTEI